jgi:excisionase family DNA binding protein
MLSGDRFTHGKEAMARKKPIDPIIPPDARVLTLAQAARYMALGEWVLRRKVWAGELPFLQSGKGARLRFDRMELDKFLQRERQQHKQTKRR